MKILLTIILTFSTIICFSKDDVDSMLLNYASNAPEFSEIEQLAEYLIKGAKTDKQKVEVFFYWIALNIKYDIDLYKQSNKTMDDVTSDVVLKTKKSICYGYSVFFKDLCEISNIECAIITGIAQSYIEDKQTETNHAWNAVNIDGKWELIDVTWGSGGTRFVSDNYIQKLDVKYLFAEPKFMIIDHFPEDPAWQLLDKSITFDEFQGDSLKEMRFRKFNNLLDDEEYRIYLEIKKANE